MNITKRITELRNLMDEKQIDAYIIPSADNHQSEYVGEYFKAREYISGFTGTAGTVVVTKEFAGIWTDGRYFIQAEKQLANTGIKLFKMGESNVQTIEEYLYDVLPEDGTLGFDGRVIAAEEGSSLKQKLDPKNIAIVYDLDFIGQMWADRPVLSTEPAFLLDIKYSGESFSSKLNRLREKMKSANATIHILTSLDDIAWLFNIRGRDTSFSPLVLSYAVVSLKDIYLFIDDEKLNDDINKELATENVKISPYNEIYDFVKGMDQNEIVMIDPTNINYSIYNNIPSEVKKVELANPTTLFKAIKNKTELENIKKSHIKDGIAFTKFMYWLKNNVGKIDISEMSASDKLEDYRKEQDGYLWPSFAPISAYKEHAAMMHYGATPESNSSLKSEHLYLTDTGGNYYEGTTDITRTIVLGEINHELKLHFTAVVRGMMNLSMAKFLYGARGYNLDILARKPMWDLGIDYKCGTGHGVGYLLNIHEGPSGFRWQIVPSKNETAPLEAGMVITDEPGIYIEDSHGIRIENELIVKLSEKTDFGQFMEFEPVTFAPIDLDAILVESLESAERNYLNEYHKLVYKMISPHLNEDEKEWLKGYTKEI